MYVLADLEWTFTKSGRPYPTQLAMLRTGPAWTAGEAFFSRFKPLEDCPDWSHCAFSGGCPQDFTAAEDYREAASGIRAWLQGGDVLCWWFPQSGGMFRQFFPALFSEHGSVTISDYLPEHFQGFGSFSQNPYKLASRLLSGQFPSLCGGTGDRKLPLPAPEHQSANDAAVMRLALQAMQFPQARLETRPVSLPPRKAAVKPKKAKQQPEQPGYLLDLRTKRAHVSGCERLDPGDETEPFPLLKKALPKGFLPCSCCASAHYKALAQRNRDSLRRCTYTYVYTPDSAVFHRYTCRSVLLARQIQGTGKYQTCVESGRRPCRLCRPTPQDPPNSISRAQAEKAAKQSAAPSHQGIPLPAQRALARFHQARKERSAYKNIKMTPKERRDFLTLTQPRFVFWAAKGYQNFHQRSCPRLKGLTSLTGFSSFKDAVRAGYSPCKQCKPTKKLDAAFSIPLGSRRAAGESCKVLESLCQEHSYPCSLDQAGTFFSLETPVGKWRINLSVKPYFLEHINLVTPWGSKTSYHRQPKLFLSLSDAFFYIHRHDSELQKKQGEHAKRPKSDT